jgi:hypothetical protein
MVLKEVFHLLLTLGIPVIITWIAIWIIKIVNEELDKHRREQYPEYFKLFDAAMDIVADVHSQTEHKTKYFEFHFKLIYKGLRDGECTVEYFREYLDRINGEYIEFATWFEAQNKEAKRLFKEADYYAKLRDLKWGYLY